MRKAYGLPLVAIFVLAMLLFSFQQPVVQSQDVGNTGTILLTCRDRAERMTSIYAYDLATGTMNLQRELGGSGTFYVGHLENGLLIENSDGPLWEINSLTLVQSNNEATVTHNNSPSIRGAWPHRIDPTGQYIQLDNIWEAPEPFSLLDLNACENGDCNVILQEGELYWSATGDDVLMQVPVEDSGVRMMYTVDENLQPDVLIGAGQQPFWTASGQVGFLVKAESIEYIDLVNVNDPDNVSTVLNSTNLSVEDRDEPIRIGGITGNPYNGNQVVVFAAPESIMNDVYADGPFYIFRYDIDTDTLTLLLELIRFPISGQFSPDGRWLGVLEGPSRPEPQLYLIDMTDGSSMNFSIDDVIYFSEMFWNMTWSPDGTQAIFMDSGRPYLITPETRERERLEMNGSFSCTTSAWQVEE